MSRDASLVGSLVCLWYVFSRSFGIVAFYRRELKEELEDMVSGRERRKPRDARSIHDAKASQKIVEKIGRSQ